MRILTLLLRHGTQKYADAEHRIDEIFERHMPGLDRTTVIVDSALDPGHAETAGRDRIILGADNDFWEWSAADRGIAYMGERIWSYDLVHMATAAFDMLYTAYLGRFTVPMLRSVAGRAACVGHIDCYNEPVRVRSYHSQHWMRSSFLFLPPSELRALRTLVTFRDSAALFSGDPEKPFRDDAPISENYRRYIFDWLTGGDIGQGVQWHSSFGLTRESLPYFQQKTVAILNEHLFSIRLRAQGCRLVDVTWLAARLSACSGEEIPWNTGWRIQLAERDDDKLVLPMQESAAHA